MILVFGIQYTSMLEVDMFENRCTPSTMVAHYVEHATT